MKVGDKVSVAIPSPLSTDPRAAGSKTVTGTVEYVHPMGRFASVRVPAGYIVTVSIDR